MRRTRVLLSLLAAAGLACTGPLGPFAGGRLSGEPAPPPDDWSFTRELMVVQLETRPDDPYSVNVGCIDHEGAIYVGSPDPESDRWVANVVANPEVRLRVGRAIYSLRATRVTGAEWVAAGRKLFEKYDIELAPGKQPGWLFRLDPR